MVGAGLVGDITGVLACLGVTTGAGALGLLLVQALSTKMTIAIDKIGRLNLVKRCIITGAFIT
jgi:hypothetical protein